MIVIVDYGLGNLGSIVNMLLRLRVDVQRSRSIEDILRADRLILPGVGAFDAGMQALEQAGLIPVLERKVRQERTPLLGICLGMQLLTQGSEEGRLPGLGWFQAATRRFRFDPPPQPEAGVPRLRIPHMGWNYIDVCRNHPILDEMHPEPRFYFVHSYYVQCACPEDVVATAAYGGRFDAIIARDNLVGAQFHPEKSHKFGLKLLENFARMNHAAA